MAETKRSTLSLKAPRKRRVANAELPPSPAADPREDEPSAAPKPRRRVQARSAGKAGKSELRSNPASAVSAAMAASSTLSASFSKAAEETQNLNVALAPLREIADQNFLNRCTHNRMPYVLRPLRGTGTSPFANHHGFSNFNIFCANAASDIRRMQREYYASLGRSQAR